MLYKIRLDIGPPHEMEQALANSLFFLEDVLAHEDCPKGLYVKLIMLVRDSELILD